MIVFFVNVMIFFIGIFLIVHIYDFLIGNKNNSPKEIIKERHTRYLRLYRLHKVEEELKHRGLSFQDLDALYFRISRPRPVSVSDVDEEFSPNKKLNTEKKRESVEKS